MAATSLGLVMNAIIFIPIGRDRGAPLRAEDGVSERREFVSGTGRFDLYRPLLAER